MMDQTTRFVNDTDHDHFLHIFEDVDKSLIQNTVWVPAVCHKFLKSSGLTATWNLSPRMIPYQQRQPQAAKALHNIKSPVPEKLWTQVLLKRDSSERLVLEPGTVHHIELEFEQHTTGDVMFHFLRPSCPGSTLCVTYTECYENTPTKIPSLRCKGDRRDNTLRLVGPQDRYVFGGRFPPEHSWEWDSGESNDEVFSPYHFRTFRFIAIDIEVVRSSQLVFKGLSVFQTNYPLQIESNFKVPSMVDKPKKAEKLWSVSLRTLLNCMHASFEDCPFYEQLQYAMDVRSSSLFTYSVSNDDRLSRQAIIQLHNSFQPALGLLASRAPCHHLQIIPHFSLFWICTLVDHYQYFGDATFVRKHLPVAHAILETYNGRVDAGCGLVASFSSTDHWDFVDWTHSWKPFGVPLAAKRTKFQTFTNSLYAYTLKHLSGILGDVGAKALSDLYESRADGITTAIQSHCWDGCCFTDGLANQAQPEDYSEQNQVWAVLCGATSPEQGQRLLSNVLKINQGSNIEADDALRNRCFTPSSTAMSFYTLRALSLVGGSLYDAHFDQFWKPWQAQLAQNVTTWVEDSVSQRSDCHAWGSVPLYEFVAEVAGVQPNEPGWGSILFKPRISLFRDVDARVVIGGHGIANVHWERAVENSTVKISLSIESSNGSIKDVKPVTIHVWLPGDSVRTVLGPGLFNYVVKL